MSGFPNQSDAALSIDDNKLMTHFGLLSAEKSVFVLVNVLDIVLTFILIRSGAFYESNPIADFVLQRWNFAGMIVFKLILTLGVIMIANFIAFRRLRTSKNLLIAGTAIVGTVVVYSSLQLYNAYPFTLF